MRDAIISSPVDARTASVEVLNAILFWVKYSLKKERQTDPKQVGYAANSAIHISINVFLFEFAGFLCKETF